MKRTAPASRPAGQNPVQMYLDDLGPSSRRPSMNGLRFMVAVLSKRRELDPLAFDWSKTTPAEANHLRRRLCDHYAPPTACSYLGAFKKVMRHAWRAGQLDAETLARVVDLEPIRGRSDPSGRAVELAELAAMMNTCTDSNGPRDRGALALLFGAGLRRRELAELTLDRLDMRPGRETVKPHGKGRKDRVIPLPPDAVVELRPWLELRGFDPGPAFGYWLRGRLRPLKPDAIYELVKRRGNLACLEPTPTPHDLRRGFATALHRADVPLLRISELMGHASTDTTARYIRQCLDEHREAVGRLKFTAAPRRQNEVTE